MAFTASASAKVRSAFVVLAVALGVSALTLIVTSVDGAQKQAREIVDMFGPDAIFVIGGDITKRAVGERVLTLSWEDARAIERSMPGAWQVVPMRSKGGYSARHRNRNMPLGRIIGATADYANSWNWPLAEGRDLSEEDVKRSAKVCLIGQRVADELFGKDTPIGQTIFVNRIPMTVVGRPTHRGVSGGGADMDDRIVIPLTTMAQRFHMDRKYFRALRVKFHNAELMEEHAENLTGFLRHLHDLDDDEDNDFTVLTADEVLKFLSMLQGGLVAFLGITAACAMLVGGFVLANLFSLSIMERTSEIGLKKALGAKHRHILVQFLAEACLLTFLGGLLGLVIGWSMGHLLSNFEMVKIEFSWRPFVLAFAGSMAIGLIFGLKPALTASRVDPIEALKSGG